MQANQFCDLKKLNYLDILNLIAFCYSLPKLCFEDKAYTVIFTDICLWRNPIFHQFISSNLNFYCSFGDHNDVVLSVVDKNSIILHRKVGSIKVLHWHLVKIYLAITW